MLKFLRAHALLPKHLSAWSSSRLLRRAASQQRPGWRESNVASPVRRAFCASSSSASPSSGGDSSSDLLLIPGVSPRNKKLLLANGFGSLSDLQSVFMGTMGGSKDVLATFLQEDVGLSKKAHADAIAEFVRQTVSSSLSDGEDAEEAPPRTCGSPRGEQITLCVEGNISAGKSTFLADIIDGSETLKEAGTSIVLEPVDKWQNVESFAARVASSDSNVAPTATPFNILDEFYGNPERYAYTFQNYVFMTRYLQEIESRDAKIPLRIMERSIFSDRMIFVESVHEKAWMSDLELSLFNGWYDPVVKASPNLVPEGFVYLRTTAETCIRRLKVRARGEETGIEVDYLQTLHDKHEAWLCPNGFGAPAAAAAAQGSSAGGHHRLPDLIKDHVFYLNDARVPTLTNVPTLILDYDDDINLDTDEDAKNRYRGMVEAFVEYVREVKKLQSKRKQSGRGSLGESAGQSEIPSFAEVQRWSAFYSDD